MERRLEFLGYEGGKGYMFEGLEKDGRVYRYLSASIFMVYGVMSFG